MLCMKCCFSAVRAGTLIQPSEDVADVRAARYSCCMSDATYHMWCKGSLLCSHPLQVYFRHGQEYGCKLSREQILHNFRRAFAQPWTHSLCRYVGDGRQFWCGPHANRSLPPRTCSGNGSVFRKPLQTQASFRNGNTDLHASCVYRNYLVVESTGCSDPALLEQLYQYYARPAAWTLAADAAAALADISAAGGGCAVHLCMNQNLDLILAPVCHLRFCVHTSRDEASRSEQL